MNYGGDYEDWKTDNRSNENCFNCRGCYMCGECNECYNCDSCWYCENCEDCENCNNCIGCYDKQDEVNLECDDMSESFNILNETAINKNTIKSKFIDFLDCIKIIEDEDSFKPSPNSKIIQYNKYDIIIDNNNNKNLKIGCIYRDFDTNDNDYGTAVFEDVNVNYPLAKFILDCCYYKYSDKFDVVEKLKEFQVSTENGYFDYHF